LLVEREVVVEFVGDPMGVEVVEESVGEREGEDPGEGNMPELWIWLLSLFSICVYLVCVVRWRIVCGR
jgi:hypothetical protein